VAGTGPDRIRFSRTRSTIRHLVHRADVLAIFGLLVLAFTWTLTLTVVGLAPLLVLPPLALVMLAGLLLLAPLALVMLAGLLLLAALLSGTLLALAGIALLLLVTLLLVRLSAMLVLAFALVVLALIRFVCHGIYSPGNY